METNVEQKKSGKFHFAYLVLIATCAIQFGCMGTVSSCMGVFTPSVIADLGTTATAVSLYFSIRTLTMAIFQPVAAYLFKKMDARLSVGLAVVLANGSMIMLSWCYNIAWWYVSAVIAGIGLAFICYLMSPILLNNWFKTGYGTAMGISLAFTGVGGMVFAPLVGQWIATYGFRTAYILTGGIGGAIALVFAILLLRTRPEDKGLKPVGYGVEKKTVISDDSGMTVKEMLKTPAFICAFLVTIFVFFGTCFMTDLTNMAVSKGFDITLASILSSCLSFGIIVGKLVLGFINDHKGARTTVLIGVVFGIVGLILLICSSMSPYFAFIGAFLFGCYVAAMSVCPPLVIRYAFGGKNYAKIYSYAAVVGVLTSTVSHPIYASTFDATGGYDVALVVAIVAAVLSVVLTYTGVTACNKKWNKKGAEKEAVEA